MQIPDFTKEKINKLYIKKRYPEFYDFILDKYKDYAYKKFTELIYCYEHNIEEHPVCPICNKYVLFLDFKRGYQKYCSLKCSNLSPEVQEKKKQTTIKHYGVEYAAQSNSIKEKILATCIDRYGGIGNAGENIKSKQQKTMEDRYGCKYAMQNQNIKNKSINSLIEKYGGIGAGSYEIREKILNTCNDKYGVGWVLESSDIRDKIKQTNINKYGFETPTINTEIGNKISDTKRLNYVNNNPDIIGVTEDGDDILYIIKCPHPECNKCTEKVYKITSCNYWDRNKNKTEPCTNILPIQKINSKNTTLELFIQRILDEYNIHYIQNDRSIINGKELDIYIPDHKLAIECNGIYWHSTKDNNYHINKWRLCKNNNIQLITIWQDWIYNKPDIVKSIILSKLGIYKERIYARKCIIKEIDSKTCNDFLDNHHIQGSCKSKYRFGLYYNDELISVMSFNTKMTCSGDNKNIKGYFELNRFCTKQNTQVIGGAEKLLKYFINNYNPEIITSFACNDISNGNLYKKLGFESSKQVNKSYWYINKINYKRYHRSTFTKSAIIKKGWASEDKNWKEKDIMYQNGYLQIYDSGQVKYMYKKRNS